jgi:hypothetical protein
MNHLIIKQWLDPQEFAFQTGLAFRGLTLSQSPNGWNIIVRAYHKHDGPVYAMTQHADILEGLAGLLSALSSVGGAKLWRHDKYAKG